MIMTKFYKYLIPVFLLFFVACNDSSTSSADNTTPFKVKFIDQEQSALLAFVETPYYPINYHYIYDDSGNRLSKQLTVINNFEKSMKSTSTNILTNETITDDSYDNYFEILSIKSSYEYDFSHNTVTEKLITHDGDTVSIIYSFDNDGYILSYNIPIFGETIHGEFKYDNARQLQTITTTGTLFKTSGTLVTTFDNEQNIVKQTFEIYDEHSIAVLKGSLNYLYSSTKDLIESTLNLTDRGQVDAPVIRTFQYDSQHHVVNYKNDDYELNISHTYTQSNTLMNSLITDDFSTKTLDYSSLEQVIVANTQTSNTSTSSSFIYHANGFLNSSTYFNLAGEFSNTSYIYNSNNQLLEKTTTYNADSTYDIEKNTYYPDGIKHTQESSELYEGALYHHKSTYYENGIEQNYYSKDTHGDYTHEYSTDYRTDSTRSQSFNISTHSDGTWNKTTRVYDVYGKVETEKQEDNVGRINTISFTNTYSTKDQLLKVIWSDTDGNFGEKNYTYHENGNKAVEEESTYNFDGSSHFAKHTYDENYNTLTSYYKYNYTDGSSHEDTSTYYQDSYNRKLSISIYTQTDSTWDKTTYNYDEKETPTTIVREDSSGYTNTETFVNSYNAQDQLVKVVWSDTDGNNGFKNYTYHPNGYRQTEEESTSNIDGSSNYFTHTYDDNWNIVYLYSKSIHSTGEVYEYTERLLENNNREIISVDTYADGTWTKRTQLYDKDWNLLSESIENG